MKLRHVFLYIVAVSIPVLSSNIAWAQTVITGCTTITQPGSYVLKNNITANAAGLKPTWVGSFPGCIVIAANFVTIDLSGHLITGPGGQSMGIAQDTTTRIGDVVENGSITGFNFGAAFAGTAHTIKDVNANVNVYGIYLTGTAHTIKDVNASNNSLYGIFLRGSAGNRVIGNTANNNGVWGIAVSQCPNLLLENMATGNSNQDIFESCSGDNRQENVPQP